MTEPITVTGGAGATTSVHFDDLLHAVRAIDGLADTADRTRTELLGTLMRSRLDTGLVAVERYELDAQLELAGAVLSRATHDLEQISTALVRSLGLYAKVEALPLNPVERLTISLGAVALGTLRAASNVHDGAAQIVDALPGVTSAAAWFVTPLEYWYAAQIPDGHPVLHDLGADTRAQATTAPRTLADLVGQLALRNGGHHGEVSVSFVVGSDGQRRAIVDIPGTKSWNPYPTHDVTSVGTDVRAMNGLPTSYEAGVLEALDRAGVAADVPVMLVGHSEGGLIAVDVARTAVRTGRFRVTHVVTAGAPIGRIVGRLPKNVSVLALENSADVVPASDGQANPSTGSITTVTVDDQRGSVTANHDIGGVYQRAAAAADHSDNPSIRDFLTTANGFLDSTSEQTTAYWITRG